MSVRQFSNLYLTWDVDKTPNYRGHKLDSGNGECDGQLGSEKIFQT